MVYGSLADDPLARAVELHPDLADDLLERIAMVVGGSICRCLLAHPKCSPAILERIARANIAYLAQLGAAPPPPDASSAEQKLFADLRAAAVYSLSRLAARDDLPAAIQGEMVAALGAVPLREHIIKQLLEIALRRDPRPRRDADARVVGGLRRASHAG